MAATVLRVLIVEDQPERQEILRSLFRDHAWVLVHTAARAVRLAGVYEFDVIALDYDLAGEAKGDVVAAALASSTNREAVVLIHSLNAPGAERIRAHLPQAIFVPINQITRDNATFKRLRAEFAKGSEIDWSHVLRGPRT